MNNQKGTVPRTGSDNITRQSEDVKFTRRDRDVKSTPTQKQMSSKGKKSAKGMVPTGSSPSSSTLTEEELIQKSHDDDVSQCDKTYKYYSSYNLAKVRKDYQAEKKRQIGYMNYSNFVGKAIFPDSYVPYRTSGDGLCFIHAAFRSVFLYYYSQDDTGTRLRRWLRSLCNYMLLFMPNLVADIDTRDITIPGDRHIEEFMFANYPLMIGYGVNIMRFVALNWYNQEVHHPNMAYLTHAAANDHDLIPQFRMSIGVSGSDNSVYAVDNHGRNFVMSILGIRRINVLQDNIRDKRFNAPIYMQSVLTTDGEYSGFQISGDHGCTVNELHPEIFAGFSDPLAVSIFSLNSNHYDILLTIQSSNVATPVEVFGSDMLPPIAPTRRYTGDAVVVGSGSMKSASAAESTSVSISTSGKDIEIVIGNIDYESMTDEMLYESLLMCDEDNVPDELLAHCMSRGISK